MIISIQHKLKSLWQPTPVFLPGKSHGWKSLVGSCPWGCQESDMTERLHLNLPYLIQVKLNIFQQYDTNNSYIQFSSVTQSCLTLCDPMDCSTPGFPVHHQLLEFTQTHVHRVSDVNHALSSPSPPNLSQHQGLFR